MSLHVGNIRKSCCRAISPVMRRLGIASVYFIPTDPPYFCLSPSRAGQTIANDARDGRLEPAFAEMYRLLRPDAFFVSFYGWNAADGLSAHKAGFGWSWFIASETLRLHHRLSRVPTRAGHSLAKGCVSCRPLLGRNGAEAKGPLNRS